MSRSGASVESCCSVCVAVERDSKDLLHTHHHTHDACTMIKRFFILFTKGAGFARRDFLQENYNCVST